MAATRLWPWLTAAALLLTTTAGCSGAGGAPAEIVESERDAEPEMIASLAKTLRLDPSTPAQFRIQAAQRLGRLGPQAAAALEALQESSVKDPDEKVRQAAAEALAKVKG